MIDLGIMGVATKRDELKKESWDKNKTAADYW